MKFYMCTGIVIHKGTSVKINLYVTAAVAAAHWKKYKNHMKKPSARKSAPLLKLTVKSIKITFVCPSIL